MLDLGAPEGDAAAWRQSSLNLVISWQLTSYTKLKTRSAGVESGLQQWATDLRRRLRRNPLRVVRPPSAWARSEPRGFETPCLIWNSRCRNGVVRASVRDRGFNGKAQGCQVVRQIAGGEPSSRSQCPRGLTELASSLHCLGILALRVVPVRGDWPPGRDQFLSYEGRNAARRGQPAQPHFSMKSPEMRLPLQVPDRSPSPLLTGG